jgi:glycosyltransferase involved in cell wall biosynthesis
MEFGPDTCAFIDEFPKMMSADVVQVYPASSDRLDAKRVKDLILIFKQIKLQGFSVCLLIANQWATKRQAREDLTTYTQIASRNGLKSDEVIFSSNFMHPKYMQGLPKRMVRELMMCANMFIFPTRDETFGLVLPEAVLSSAVLPVCNKSLQMMGEITGHTCDYIDFGSFNLPIQEFPPDFHSQVARTVMGRFVRNESILTRTFIRQRYNWDNLYDKYYRPILSESANWV